MSETARSSYAERSQKLRQGLQNSVTQLEQVATSTVNAAQLSTAQRKAEAEAQLALLDQCSEVCNDMLALRGSDAWSVCFAYLVNLSVAGYLCSSHCGNASGVAAMSSNLRALIQSLKEKFPGGRMSVDGLARSLDALPTAPPGDVALEPHPYVDTLAKQVLTVRDTGLALKSFRQYYALVGTRVHVVPPA